MPRNLARQQISHFMKSKISFSTKKGTDDKIHCFVNFSCFIIEADKTDRNRVIGHLKVNPEFPIDIDYEEYEVIYLAIFVTDLNQEVNEDTSDGDFLSFIFLKSQLNKSEP